MSYQKELILLKPGVQKQKIVGVILTRIEQKNLDILGCKLLVPKKSQIEKLYAQHKKQPFYLSTVKYMTSEPIFAFVIGGNEAVAVCRQLCGATNPIDASPGTIRGDFALSISANVIHASDSIKSARSEISIFFTIARNLQYFYLYLT